MERENSRTKVSREKKLWTDLKKQQKFREEYSLKDYCEKWYVGLHNFYERSQEAKLKENFEVEDKKFLVYYEEWKKFTVEQKFLEEFPLTEYCEKWELGQQKREFNDADCKVIAKIIESNSTIKKFFLYRNDIHDDGFKAICDNLKEHLKLEHVNCFWNHIGNTGITALSEKLNASKIKYLNFEENEIGDDGMKALAEKLKTNTTVTYLNLQMNKIKNEGATGIAAALLENKTLENMNLSWNSIGDAGMIEIAQTLEKIVHLPYWMFLLMNLKKSGGKIDGVFRKEWKGN
eukprot:TRINITY_DN146_c0_g1_i2.p1 TRINITY_DN146_c0_g1~~TRINITY_DN146_c0_g1_i2.p1  ORF type:complete len:290 (-),score=57.23 TRINITY_DN146_c0_g1_i2:657-1526(-)